MAVLGILSTSGKESHNIDLHIFSIVPIPVYHLYTVVSYILNIELKVVASSRINPPSISYKIIHIFLTYVLAFVSAMYIVSQRGKQLIKMGGFTFCRHRYTAGKQRWMCSTNANKKCSAAIYTVDDRFVFVNNIHNHPHRL